MAPSRRPCICNHEARPQLGERSAGSRCYQLLRPCVRFAERQSDRECPVGDKGSLVRRHRASRLPRVSGHRIRVPPHATSVTDPRAHAQASVERVPEPLQGRLSGGTITEHEAVHRSCPFAHALRAPARSRGRGRHQQGRPTRCAGCRLRGTRWVLIVLIRASWLGSAGRSPGWARRWTRPWRFGFPASTVGCGRRESGRVAYLRLGGPVKLIDRSQVLVGEVLACGHKGLENRVQEWHRGLGALLNLAYEL